MADSDEASTKVYARVRKLMPWEEQKLGCKWNCENNTLQNYIDNGGRDNKSYRFSKVFPPASTNPQVFDKVCAPLLNKVMQGYNAILIAYGQTGSGKTFSMLGKPRLNIVGLLPMCLHWLLDQDKVESIHLSAIEAFGHHVAKIGLYDLFSKENDTMDWTKKKGNPNLDPKEGITKIHLQSKEEATDNLLSAHARSHFAPTGKNPESSRGHIAFIISLKINNGDDSQTVNMLLVDLAGSEGDSALKGDFAKKASQATITARRLEGGCINTGLSQLQVIFGELASRGHLSRTIGNGLRRILHPFINNQTYLSVIFCISPSFANRMTTESTLKFASRACRIKTQPVKAKVKTNWKKVVEKMKETMKQKEIQLHNMEEEMQEYVDVAKHSEMETQELKSVLEKLYQRLWQRVDGVHEIFEKSGALDHIDVEHIRESLPAVPQFTSQPSHHEGGASKELMRKLTCRRETIMDLQMQLQGSFEQLQTAMAHDDPMLVVHNLELISSDSTIPDFDMVAAKHEVEKDLKLLDENHEQHNARDEQCLEIVFQDQLSFMEQVRDNAIGGAMAPEDMGSLENGGASRKVLLSEESLNQLQQMEMLKSELAQMKLDKKMLEEELEHQKIVAQEMQNSHSLALASALEKKPKEDKHTRRFFVMG